MASTNQSPQYQKAEQEYLQATTTEEKLACLEIMMKECPKHKSSENMLANLRTRYKKFKQSLEKSKKSGKSLKKGIKKSDMQALIIGMPNTGKSSFFSLLTKQKAKTSPHAFSTYKPQLGSLDYKDTKIQIIDMPSFPNADHGLINSSDTLLLIIDNLNQIQEAKQFLKNTKAKIITIFNKSDLLDEQQKRKTQATLKSEKQDFFILSSINPQQDLSELKKQIFETFPVIRVYTKEPKKQPTAKPMILKKDSTIKDFAEKILKGLSLKIKTTKIWGPSSKFSGQTAGLDHILKDKDIVELQTK